MELIPALRTTGAVREFSDQPVPDAVVHRILDNARFAPSGGNRQSWRAILAKDPIIKRRLRDLYLTGWYEYLAMGAAGLVPWAPITDRPAEAEAVARAPEMRRLASQGAGGMAEHLDEVPALIVVVANLRALAAVDRDHDRYPMIGGASVYPFVWNVLLAAHEEGLGGVITTMLAREEPEVLDLLGVPEGYALACAIALGHPSGTRPTRLRRTAVEDFATVDRFDGPALSG